MLEIVKSYTPYLTFGAGIERRPSTLGEKAGMGLFVTRDCVQGQKITVYDGHLVHSADFPIDGTRAKDPNFDKVISIRKYGFAIYGEPSLMLGRGGAQFSNHSKERANCVLHVLKNEDPGSSLHWRYFGELAMSLPCTRTPVVVLVAIRNIAANEELFWRYPKGACLAHGISDESNPVSTDDIDTTGLFADDESLVADMLPQK